MCGGRACSEVDKAKGGPLARSTGAEYDDNIKINAREVVSQSHSGREESSRAKMEKYFGNAYRGDPGVPHADPDRFVNIWIGSAAFSALTWINPYMWQRSNQFKYSLSLSCPLKDNLGFMRLFFGAFLLAFVDAIEWDKMSA